MPRFQSIEYKWVVAIAFVAGFFMDLMDTTIVNVALPTLSKDLHASSTALEWMVNGYLLSLAIWIPASGWLGDKFGTKKVFLFALAMFTLGSFLCSIAPSAGFLIFYRVLQGVGGGMMTPVGVTMLFRAFPPNERAMASSVLAVPAAVAPALGPALGGWLVDYAGWKWIFLVNVPIGILAFLFSYFFLKEYQEQNVGRFDYVGFILSGAGLVSLLYALSIIPNEGFKSWPVILFGIIGIILLIVLPIVESRLKSPLLRFDLYKERLFRATNIVMFFAFALWIGFLFVLPLYLQELRGFSAFDSGLATAPQAIGWLVMSFFATNLYHKLGPRTMISIGLFGVTIMSVLFFFFGFNTSLWIIRADLFVRGVFMAFAIIPVQAATFSNISPRETGRASSLFNTNRQVAGSFGVAALGTILFEFMKIFSQNPIFVYHLAFAASGLLGILAVFFALQIKDEDAAASFTNRAVVAE